MNARDRRMAEQAKAMYLLLKECTGWQDALDVVRLIDTGEK
jgi:hypothetical protein